MKVTQVALRPTSASEAAGRPSLTPELLAASGARYSRSNDGLEAILAKIDPQNLDKSVDSIFKMIDYGHQSIADMVPVALFMDGVSLWLAYHIWTLCPVAGGQESSTRYINYQSSQGFDADVFGIPESRRDAWQAQVRESFAAYEKALQIWETIAEREPSVMRLPQSLLDDSSEKARKQVARMRRNYAFDRARNFLPTCAPTNVMMVQSARAWAILCAHLCSHALPEAQRLGAAIRDELELAAPRMTRHAGAKASLQNGQNHEFETWQKLARERCVYLESDAIEHGNVADTDNGIDEHGLNIGSTSTDGAHEHPPNAFLSVNLPRDVSESDLCDALQFHDNRYAWIGSALQRSSTRFGWDAVALAEIRDLNRHRTGTKWCPLVPKGFYAATDQLPPQFADEYGAQLHELSAFGRDVSRNALNQLRDADASYVYSLLLGTQFSFEHTTTADKFLYEAELRTGTGAHFRYAQHLRDVLQLWYQKFPSTKDRVLEGSAEPE